MVLLSTETGISEPFFLAILNHAAHDIFKYVCDIQKTNIQTAYGDTAP